MDLAKGHIAALRKLKEQCGCRVGRKGEACLERETGSREDSWSDPLHHSFFPGQIYNLGTGTGYSVLQMVQAMEKASGRKVGRLYSSPTLAPPTPASRATQALPRASSAKL